MHRLRLLLPLLLVPVLAGTARAEIAVLSNGLTLKLDRHRLEAEQVVLELRGGGELGVPASLVRGFVPDEVLDEVDVPGGDVRALAAAAARRHGLDPELVLAVVSVESGFRPQAVSPKGAQGLMQLMPRTAGELGVTDAFDPQQNLDGGVRHLGSLLSLYGGDVRRALAAYNAGQGAVARHNGVPPYAETRAYVERVLGRYTPPGSGPTGAKPKKRAAAAPKDAAAPPKDAAAPADGGSSGSESATPPAPLTRWPPGRRPVEDARAGLLAGRADGGRGGDARAAVGRRAVVALPRQERQGGGAAVPRRRDRGRRRALPAPQRQRPAHLARCARQGPLPASCVQGPDDEGRQVADDPAR